MQVPEIGGGGCFNAFFKPHLTTQNMILNTKKQTMWYSECKECRECVWRLIRSSATNLKNDRRHTGLLFTHVQLEKITNYLFAWNEMLQLCTDNVFAPSILYKRDKWGQEVANQYQLTRAFIVQCFIATSSVYAHVTFFWKRTNNFKERSFSWEEEMNALSSCLWRRAVYSPQGDGRILQKVSEDYTLSTPQHTVTFVVTAVRHRNVRSLL